MNKTCYDCDNKLPFFQESRDKNKEKKKDVNTNDANNKNMVEDKFSFFENVF